MTAIPKRLQLEPAAQQPYLDLLIALAGTEHPTPCQRWPDAFTSDNHRERAEAAAACSHCPVLSHCEAYADAQGEQHHVWAGADRTPTTKKERAA